MDQFVAMTALKARFLQNDLLFSLNLNYLKDFIEILKWVERYAQAKKAWDQQGENLDGGSQSNVGKEKKKDY